MSSDGWDATFAGERGGVLMTRLLSVAALGLTAMLTGLPVSSAQSAALKIVVIAGEDGVNVIQQKTAVAPVVEVRDRNDLPVAGATVTFSVAGKGATFGPGAQTFTVATDSAGRAMAAGFNPTVTGPVQINVQATYQGQTAGTTITQTNVLTAAQAAASASTAASAGAAAGGAAGGGLSAGAIAGIVGAGVGGAALGAKALKKEDPPPGTATPPPAAPTAPVRIAVSPSGKGIREVTEFTFSASGGSPGSPTFTWDFGDGTGATGGQVTHVFTRDGTFQVRVHENERTEQSTSQLVEVGTLTGAWRTPYEDGGSYFRLLMVQQGARLTGQWTHICTGDPFCTRDSAVPLSGQIKSPRTVSISEDGICRNLVSDGTVNNDLTGITGGNVVRDAFCIQFAKDHGGETSYTLTFARE